jgi:hypothetical protein
MVNCKPQKVHNLQGACLAIVAVFAVLFPSMWFIDVVFALVGGRSAKMVNWSAALFMAISLAIYLKWLKPRIDEDTAICMLLALFAAIYFLSCQIVTPPFYNNLQAI